MTKKSRFNRSKPTDVPNGTARGTATDNFVLPELEPEEKTEPRTEDAANTAADEAAEEKDRGAVPAFALPKVTHEELVVEPDTGDDYFLPGGHSPSSVSEPVFFLCEESAPGEKEEEPKKEASEVFSKEPEEFGESGTKCETPGSEDPPGFDAFFREHSPLGGFAEAKRMCTKVSSRVAPVLSDGVRKTLDCLSSAKVRIKGGAPVLTEKSSAALKTACSACAGTISAVVEKVSSHIENRAGNSAESLRLKGDTAEDVKTVIGRWVLSSIAATSLFFLFAMGMIL